MLFQGSKVDLQIQVDRLKLISTLKTNLEAHKKMHQVALKGYHDTLVRVAEKNLSLAKEKKYPDSFPHRKPTSYAEQYSRAIKMLEMSEDDKVTLSAVDFARFVEDDWDWKREFVAVSEVYRADG